MCVGVGVRKSEKGKTRNLSFAVMLKEEKLDQCGSCLLVKMMNYATREGEGKKGLPVCSDQATRRRPDIV